LFQRGDVAFTASPNTLLFVEAGPSRYYPMKLVEWNYGSGIVNVLNPDSNAAQIAEQKPSRGEAVNLRSCVSCPGSKFLHIERWSRCIPSISIREGLTQPFWILRPGLWRRWDPARSRGGPIPGEVIFEPEQASDAPRTLVAYDLNSRQERVMGEPAPAPFLLARNREGITKQYFLTRSESTPGGRRRPPRAVRPREGVRRDSSEKVYHSRTLLSLAHFALMLPGLTEQVCVSERAFGPISVKMHSSSLRSMGFQEPRFRFYEEANLLSAADRTDL
jgi:hypothetical protein